MLALIETLNLSQIGTEDYTLDLVLVPIHLLYLLP